MGINTRGEEHGTITARINDKENYEVTTLRIDKVTDGRHAEVEFTTDWQLDANRRDLTINSMFLGLDGTLHDFFNGEEDLANQRVRFVGDPVNRIQEDYLRILRYFRFYGRISTSPSGHEEETLTAIKNNVGGMGRISGERVWMEWKKILTGNFAGELSELMVEVGLGPFIGLPASPDVSELRSVWARSQEKKVRLEAPSLLSSLVRDEKEVMGLHGRLKLSGLERDLLMFVTQNRADLPHPVPIRPYQFLVVDSRAKPQDTCMFLDQVLQYRGDLDLAAQLKDWEVPRFPVTGHHLKEAGCPPGKLMAVIMTQLKDAWKQSDFEMSVEKLVERIPNILENINPETIEKLDSKGGKKKRKLSR